MPPKLLDYIKKNVQNGLALSEIEKKLLDHGWSRDDIHQAFSQLPASFMVDRESTHVIPGIGTLLKNTWIVFQRRQVFFLKILAVSVIPVTLEIGVLYLTFIFLFSYIFFGGSAAAAFVILCIGLFCAGVILSWVVKAMFDCTLEERGDIFFTFLRAIPKAVPFFWILFLMGLFIFSAGIFFLIPGIILFVRFSFAPLIFTQERIGGFQALSKSNRYVKGVTAQVLGKLFVFYGSIALFFYLFGTIFFALSTIHYLPVIILKYLCAGTIILATIYFSPFVILFQHVLFEFVKAHKDIQMPAKPYTVLKTGFFVLFFFWLGVIIIFYAYFLQLASHLPKIIDPSPVINVTPTIPSLPSIKPSDNTDQTDEFVQFACQVASGSAGDTCSGYHLMLPGYESDCYTKSECVDAYHRAQIAPKLLQASPSATATPSATPTANPGR